MDWQEALSFWNWANSRLGAFHLYAALAALVIGPLVLLRRKGDIMHRLLGLTYVFAMLTTNASAFSLYDFTGKANFFHLFALVSTVTIAIGLVAIVIYAVKRSKGALEWHLQMMSWSYYGLVLAAVAEAATRGAPRLFQSSENFWIPFFIVFTFTGVIGGVLTARLLKPVSERWTG